MITFVLSLFLISSSKLKLNVECQWITEEKI